MFFLWDERNAAHIGEHYVELYEAEYVVRHARRPYPRFTGNGKWMVHGRTMSGRPLQDIYVKRTPNQIDMTLLTPGEQLALLEGEAAAHVVHARELRRGEHLPR